MIIPKQQLRLLILGAMIPVILCGILLGVVATYYGGQTGSGIVMNGGKIINSAEPSSATDAATKNYTDSTAKPAYMGLTASAYTGNLGGIDGANAKCNTDYPGSHLCTMDEIVRSGRTTSLSTGWLACDIMYGTVCSWSMTTVDTGDTDFGDCAAFTSASSADLGFVGTSGSVTAIACNTNFYGVHCCR